MRKYEDVECPTCGAKVGEMCWNVRDVLVRHPVGLVHAARKKLSANSSIRWK